MDNFKLRQEEWKRLKSNIGRAKFASDIKNEWFAIVGFLPKSRVHYKALITEIRKTDEHLLPDYFMASVFVEEKY